MADAAGGDPTVTAPTAVLGMGMPIIALLAIAVTYWLLLQNKVRGSPFDVPAAPEPEQPGDFVFIGVKPRALTRLLDIYPEIVGKKLTTSDVCHTILKPMTVPAGGVDRATCTNAEESWYAHQYHREGQTVQATWEESDRCFICQKEFTFFFRRHHCRSCGHSVCREHSQHKQTSFGYTSPKRSCDTCWTLLNEGPPGTCSYADLLKKDHELSDLVGFPTVFWSHPWKDQFADVVTTMNE